MRAVRAAAWVGAVVLGGIGGCGERATRAPLVPAGALAVVGTTDDVPAAPRFEVEVTADGGVHVDGRLVSYPALVDAAAARAKAAGFIQGGASHCAALLRIDARTRWDVAMWVVIALVDPRVKIADVYYAVRGEDGSEAALFLPLPQDRCCGPGDGSGAAPGNARIALRSSDRRPEPAAAYNAVWTALHAAGERSTARIDAPADVAVGCVLETADLCLRAGASQIEFMGVKSEKAPEPPPGMTEIQAHVARVGPAMAGFEIRAGGLIAAAGTATEGLPSVPAGSRRRAQRGTLLISSSEPMEETEEVHTDDVIAREPTPKGENDSTRPAPKKSEDAVTRALDWLAAHQSPGGAWSVDAFGETCHGKPVPGATTDGAGSVRSEVGVTALAVLAFLGAGYSSDSKGPYGLAVARGVARLRRAEVEPERATLGSLSGRSGDAWAALALVREFTATGHTDARRSAERLFQRVVPRVRRTLTWEEADVVLAATVAAGLLAARDGAPDASHLAVDATLLDEIPAVFHALTDDTGRTRRASIPPPEGIDAATAASVWTRVQLGANSRSSGDVVLGARLLRDRPPRWSAEAGRTDFLEWWFGTIAAFSIGGETWKVWESGLGPAVLQTQRLDGDDCGLRGSWDPVDVHGREGGRVYATAILCLCSEVYFRYDRVFTGRSMAVEGK